MTKRILLLCVLTTVGLAAFGATPAFAASTAVTQNAWFQNQNRIIEVNNRVRVSWNYNGGSVSNGRCQWTWSKLNFWSLSGRTTNCLYEQNYHRVHGWQLTTFTSTRFCPNQARTTVSTRNDVYAYADGSAVGNTTFVKSGACKNSLFAFRRLTRG